MAAAERGVSGAPAIDPATEVKVLADATDPFAANAPTTAPADLVGAPATQPVAAATQPSEGQSVSASEVSMSDAGTVEIHVNDANLVEVLRMLSLQSQKNIVASKEVRGTVTANLYDVTVREALDAILHANGYGYREKGNFIYVYTTKELTEIEKAERQMRTDVFHIYYTNALNAATMIKPVLSTTGQVAVTTPAKAGIGSAPSGGGGNDHASDDCLVVTDYPENLEAVKKVLAEVDRRPQQILLEATILRAELNEDNALGVDFNILGGVDLNAVQIGETTGQMTGAGVIPTAPPVGAADQTAQIVRDGKAGTVGTGNSFTSPIKGGLQVGYLTNSVSIFVSALEQTTDTTIVGNPKILAVNKQQGEVFVGNEDGYYTTVTTETTTSQSVESLKTGTRLVFRPYIGSDGYIRMEVHPEDSSGQVNANGLPSKSTTEMTSNIMVKDGHTIVIGGLFRETTVSGKSQIPFLGNLPLAGVLFRNQHDRTVREEVIILLTPHIVKDDASFSKLSEEELRRVDQLRTGVRKGLMPWGRERLAEGWYEGAKRELAKPHPNRGAALWNLDAALNSNPKFMEAIELKEQLTGSQVISVDNSSVRSFVRRAILNDVAVPTTMPSTRPVHTMGPSVRAGESATTQPTASATTQPSDFDATAAVPSTQPADETAANDESDLSDSDMAETDDAAMEQTADENADGTAVETAVAPSVVPAEPTAVAPVSEESAEPNAVAVDPTDAAAEPTAIAPATEPANVETAVTPLEETGATITAPADDAAGESDTSSSQK